MFVKMLTSMAGSNYSYTPGQLVPVDEEVGSAWIKSGIAVASSGDDETEDTIERLGAENLRLSQENHTLVEENNTLKALNEELGESSDADKKALEDEVLELKLQIDLLEADKKALQDDYESLKASTSNSEPVAKEKVQKGSASPKNKKT